MWNDACGAHVGGVSAISVRGGVPVLLCSAAAPGCSSVGPQVWSWKYENGGYRTASLAETSATSTESNAVQVGCCCRACRQPESKAGRVSRVAAPPSGVSVPARSYMYSNHAEKQLRTLLACAQLLACHTRCVQLWSHAFIAVPGPTGGTLLES